MNTLNFFGKVDPDKTVVTPDMFHFRMKELYNLSDAEFERLKNELIKPTTTTLTNLVSEEASKYFLDKEKDRRFESLFRELWPNLYKQASEFEPKKHVTPAELLSLLDKSRSVYNLMIQQNLQNCKNLMSTHGSASSSLITAPSEVAMKIPTAKYGENINISIITAKPNIEITSDWTLLNPVTIPKTVETSSYLTTRNPNQISSYNSNTFYSETFLKQIDGLNLLNTRENELIKSIQESQEKLKMVEKLNRTNMIVDDIVNKAKKLQDEIKIKSTNLQIEKEKDKLNKERENRFFRPSSSIYFENEPFRVYPSRSNEKYCRFCFEYSSNSSKNYQCHNEAHHNHKHIVSILKPSYSSRLPHRSPSSNRRSSSNRPRFVESKVDCWNHTYVKNDNNIY